MDINDKLGKDRAQELENIFVNICGDKPEVREIAKKTKMYKFLSATNSHRAFTSTDGLTKYPERSWKVPRNLQMNKILHIITLNQYFGEGVINQEEYDTLKSMLDSPDTDNAQMVEMLFEVKHRPLWQKQRSSFKRKIKKLWPQITLRMPPIPFIAKDVEQP